MVKVQKSERYFILSQLFLVYINNISEVLRKNIDYPYGNIIGQLMDYVCKHYLSNGSWEIKITTVISMHLIYSEVTPYV